MKKSLLVVNSLLFLSLSANAQISVSIAVNTASALRQPISPYIYGVNGYVYDNEWGTWGAGWKPGLNNHGSSANLTAMNTTSWRIGGNSMSAYNWEQGANNGGSDDAHKSSSYQTYIVTGNSSIPPGPDFFPPAQALKTTQDHALSLGAKALIQLPMVGYVAADITNVTCGTPTATPTRWKQVINNKPTPLSLTPDLTDGFVYVDECLHQLINQFGNSSTATGIKSYQLDNEVGLWAHYKPGGGVAGTHSVVHPNLTTCAETISKTIDLAKTVKRMDTTAEVFTAGVWGYSEWHSIYTIWDGASHQPNDWASYNVEPYKTNNTGQTYRYNKMTWVNGFLDNLKQAEIANGKRLVDVLAIHYYPTGITSDIIRKQAPRSLWDVNYVENTWITQVGNGFTDGRSLELLPKMKQAINDFYPNTKLAITEYDFGGRHNISGTIAQADALGIFGRQNIYWATFFGIADDYVSPGFKIFRNYNGLKSTFGNTYIDANSNDATNNSTYASIFNNNEDELHLVLINKSETQNQNANITISSPTGKTYINISDAWGVHQADGTPDITSKSKINTLTGTDAIVNNTLRYNLPPNAVYHLVLKASVALPVEIIRFYYKKTTNVQLMWQVATEQNLSHYEVEKCTNALSSADSFEKIGIVRAEKNQNYEFEDATTWGNNENIRFYRLKMVDNDGKSAYSSILSVKNNVLEPPVEEILVIYDLYGRYLGDDMDILQNGVYIINGKKVVKMD